MDQQPPSRLYASILLLLLLQGQAGWFDVLANFTMKEQRKGLAGLYDTSCGCELARQWQLNRGLMKMLKHIIEPVTAGSPAVILSGSYYRTVLQVRLKQRSCFKVGEQVIHEVRGSVGPGCFLTWHNASHLGCRASGVPIWRHTKHL